MENWKDITGFPGYQVSDQGRIRTFWKRKHHPTGYGSFNTIGSVPKIMCQSDDGNGYAKVMLYSKIDGKRYCKKVHRLVAEAFIPRYNTHCDTVDHITSGRYGKLNNSVSNLRWIPRSENIQKAYRDGVCDERIRCQNKAIVATDLWTGETKYFSSIKETAYHLGVDRTAISHVLSWDTAKASHYTFEYADREDILLYGNENY